MTNSQQDLGLPTLDNGSQDLASDSMIASFQALGVSTPFQNTLVQPAVESSIVQPNSPALEGFTAVPNLPLEIRRIIWGHSLPGPRIIEISWNSRFITDELRILGDDHSLLFNIMRACKEAEEVVLGRYNKFKAEAWHLTGLPHTSASIVLFDDKQDTVRLSGSKAPQKFLSFASKEILDRMTSIGLDRRYFMPEVAMCCRSGRSSLLHAYLLQMPNLRKIVIFGDQTPPADDRRVLERSVFSGAWVRGTEGEVQQLVERDHLLSYLRDVEIEAGSYGEDS